VEFRARVEDFLTKAFEKFYITIWSCMKLEDVLEVLPMFMPKNFMDQFVFIWGHEQCSKMVSQISLESHYYLKDLKCIYLWLLWTTLWEGVSNIIHWWWT
jgi:hypothetical protein